MKQRALLTLGYGDWQQGFSSVTLQLWDKESSASSSAAMQFSGSLPAAPQLEALFQQWRSHYVALYAHAGIWQRTATATNILTDGFPIDALRTEDAGIEDGIEIDEDAVTQVSLAEFIHLGKELRSQLNDWLESPSFRTVDRQLRTQLSPGDEIYLILTAENPEVLSYPWHLWHLFEDYPRSELALSSINYKKTLKQQTRTEHHKVSILAILGDAAGIDIEADQQILSDLPAADITLLSEPSLEELHQQLWHGKWDIFFFAGHSSSQDGGVLTLNQTEKISVIQLKYALKTAIAKGLRLAILNSCDGLRLAWDLADLHIPQVIVMREPVPDQVAQRFLKHFLKAFATGSSLYLAVRAAREQLQPMESQYPCATWLPVIVQNPAEQPVSWLSLQGGESLQAADQRLDTPVRSSFSALPTERGPEAAQTIPAFVGRTGLKLSLLATLLTTAAVVTLRLLGGLEAVELYAYDRLMQLRPAESPDARFLVVTISEADIRAQSPERQGSLSDAALDQLLTELYRHQARVIGLDIYRDFAVSAAYPKLAARLQASDRIVGICKSRDPIADPEGVAPPPELTEDLVGFSDFIDDADGIIRRQLVALESDPAATCTTPYAFNARLAFLYLQQEQFRGDRITPGFDATGNLTMGAAVFPRLRPRSGGYQPIDAGGNQILLNYRALPTPGAIADQVSLTQILSGQVNPEAIQDRIVLVGVTANSFTDNWATPYGSNSNDKTAGVFLQAQMASQLISAALDERPVLRVFAPWGDVLWIVSWGVSGWGIGVALSRTNSSLRWQSLSVVVGLSLLTGGSLWLLASGYWLPLVPAGLSFIGSSLGTASLRRAH